MCPWHPFDVTHPQGELDFKESFRQRIKLLKGFEEKELQNIANNLPVTEGAPRLISNLKRFQASPCAHPCRLLFPLFLPQIVRHTRVDTCVSTRVDTHAQPHLQESHFSVHRRFSSLG